MVQENPFINEAFSKIEIPKTPPDYLNKELQEDISLFSEEEKSLVLKQINDEDKTAEEQSKYDLVRSRWWKEKYGFPFENKIAREEVIIRKYASEKENQDKKDLQTQLMYALEINDASKIVQIKKKYIDTYPNQLEGIETLFGIRNFLKKQQYLTKHGHETDYNKRTEIFKDLTEYQFLFTHFILLNSDDPEFMNIFWKTGFVIAEKMGAGKEFTALRRCQVSQVAAYKIIDSIGKKPKLSHPDEDAFNAIDLWTESGQALQIKGWNEKKPAIIKTDTIAFPAIQIDGGNKKSVLFNSTEYVKSKNVLFRAKIKNYGNKIGKDISGYMLMIPYSKIDFNTGEPTPELIEFFRQKLKE